MSIMKVHVHHKPKANLLALSLLLLLSISLYYVRVYEFVFVANVKLTPSTAAGSLASFPATFVCVFDERRACARVCDVVHVCTYF